MMDINADLGASTHVRASTLNPTVTAGFLIAYPVVGFAVWIRAFWSQPRGRKDFKDNALVPFRQCNVSSFQSVHNSLAFLFVVDLLYGINSIVLGSGLIDYCQNGRLCIVSSLVFDVTRNFSIILHLVVTLVTFFHICHPSEGSYHRYVVAAVLLVIVVVSATYVYVSGVAFIIVAIVILGLTVIVSVKSKAPVTTVFLNSKKNLARSTATFTSWVVFFPSFVIGCMVLNGSGGSLSVTYLQVLFYTSFNVIVDGVLCAIILSLSNEEQEQQPPPQWQQPPPQWQQPPPQWQQPPPQWQQPPPQGQQPPPQWQQPPPQWQQPPPQQ